MEAIVISRRMNEYIKKFREKSCSYPLMEVFGIFYVVTGVWYVDVVIYRANHLYPEELIEFSFFVACRWYISGCVELALSPEGVRRAGELLTGCVLGVTGDWVYEAYPFPTRAGGILTAGSHYLWSQPLLSRRGGGLLTAYNRKVVYDPVSSPQ